METRCRRLAIAARKLVFAVAALVVRGLTFGVARTAGVNPDQPIRLDGMELFFGKVPRRDPAQPSAGT